MAANEDSSNILFCFKNGVKLVLEVCIKGEPGMVAHACSPSTWVFEASLGFVGRP